MPTFRNLFDISILKCSYENNYIKDFSTTIKTNNFNYLKKKKNLIISFDSEKIYSLNYERTIIMAISQVHLIDYLKNFKNNFFLFF